MLQMLASQRSDVVETVRPAEKGGSIKIMCSTFSLVLLAFSGWEIEIYGEPVLLMMPSWF